MQAWHMLASTKSYVHTGRGWVVPLPHSWTQTHDMLVMLTAQISSQANKLALCTGSMVPFAAYSVQTFDDAKHHAAMLA